MINLLPPIENEKIKQKIIKKKILAFGTVFILSLLIFSFSLFSIKSFISFKVKEEKKYLEHRKKSLNFSQFKNFEKEIKKANQEFSFLNSFYKKQIISSLILEKIVNSLAIGMYLKHLSYSETEKNRIKIVLNGYALKREDILEFKKGLKKNKNFKNIYSPISNLLQQKDIDFHLEFMVEK